MTLKKLIRDSGNPITSRHEKWLRENPSPEYSEKAIKFAERVFRQEVGGSRNRNTKFRGSSVEKCERAQMFRAIGMEETPFDDSKTSNIFATGNSLHLKWQMAGLTEGWLEDAEVAVELPELELGGTLDGILYDGSGFEFKTVNNRGYAMAESTGKPQKGHISQVQTYMMMTDIEKFSIVYENKDNQEWREFVIPRDEEEITDIRGRIFNLYHDFKEKRLPKVKRTCLDEDGWEYRNCPYRDRCLGIKSWP